MTEEKKPEEQTAMDPLLASFISKHRSRFSMWAKDNGNTNFPITMGPDGQYRWLNREERRRLQKRRK